MIAETDPCMLVRRIRLMTSATTSPTISRPSASLLFGTTIFVGAFLLFQVQPLIGKYILPWFGGSPAVWTTCMLFFQVALLAGYAYAHASVKFLPPRGQMILHLVLLIAALVSLPVIPSQRWAPTASSNPIPLILAMLAVSVGLPYIILAATGPLLQAWYGRVWPGASPYRLYALSNVASLLALVSYPFLIEPNFTRNSQASIWGAVLIVFSLACAVTAIVSSRFQQVASSSSPPKSQVGPKNGKFVIAMWILLPAFASALFLAVTNRICQDIAVIPLLWVLPLAIYLLSFIISFDSPRWYIRWIWIPLMALSLTMLCWGMFRTPDEVSIISQIGIHCAALFTCCMICHGELYRLRPGSQHLTTYYLLIAAGGALGGIAVGIISPLIFNDFYEFHIALFGIATLTLVILIYYGMMQQVIVAALVSSALVLFGLILGVNAFSYEEGSSQGVRYRNFYGVLTVFDMLAQRPLEHFRKLEHGTITHGVQFQHPALKNRPTAYYGPESGVGLALQYSRSNGPLHVGAVGLGIGTVLAYGQEGDEFRAYEINPTVDKLSQEQFTFRQDCKAKVEVVLGDARLSLQQEPSPQQFDVLVLDAFSGDAIPVHLLTKECFDIYLKHLKPGGVIAVHITNQHVDLGPVMLRVAEHFDLKIAHIVSPPFDPARIYLARWVLFSSNQAWIESEPIRSASSPIRVQNQSVRLWTDDDANLFHVLGLW